MTPPPAITPEVARRALVRALVGPLVAGPIEEAQLFGGSTL